MKRWAKLHCGLPEDDKIKRVSVPARLLYIYSMCYAKERESNGFLRKRDVLFFAYDIESSPKKLEKLVKELTEIGLWETGDFDADYRIHNWVEWQGDCNTHRERREKESKRISELRVRKGVKSEAVQDLYGSTNAGCTPVRTLSKSREYRVESREYSNTTDTTLRETSGSPAAEEGFALSGNPPPTAKPGLPNEAKLDELLDAWNQLPEGFAPRVAKRRSDTIERLWRSSQTTRDLREALADVPTLMAAIRASPRLDRRATPDATWFDFAWLFGRGTANKELNAVKILQGNYRGENGRPRNNLAGGAGVNYDPSEGDSGGVADWSERPKRG